MAPTDSEINRQEIRSLSGNRQRSVREWLIGMAALPDAEAKADSYGEGELIASLERDVAALFGKESGVFVIKGVIAQLAALRAWTDRTGSYNVALHYKSHINLDEGEAFERLHPLHGIRLGDNEPFLVRDLEAIGERLGAVVVELPLRRAGYKLPSWEELIAISEWCRANKVPIHFDGARIWECIGFYDREYAEIAALADSIYVSFYKGLGGLAGCVLAGPADFIKEANVWKGRHGGNLYTAFPYVLSARDGLREHLPRMRSYYARAREIAQALRSIEGVRVAPDPPHTNAFQVYLPGSPGQLMQATQTITDSEKVRLFRGFMPSAIPGMSMSELVVGDAVEALTNEEIARLVARLVSLAAATIVP